MLRNTIIKTGAPIISIMISRRKNSVALPDEVEALQTDVMRFMAIICMCLMTVFALVKSMPISGEVAKPKMVKNKAFLDVEIDAMEVEAKKLERRIESLENKIVQKQKQLDAVDFSMTTVQNNKRELKDELLLISRQMDEARKETAEIKVKAEKAKKDLRENLQSLKKVNLQISKEWISVRKVKKTTEEVKLRLAAIQNKIEKLSKPVPPAPLFKEPEPEPEPEAESEEETSPKEPVKEQKQGFTLGFSSNKALRHLLFSNEGISMYLIAGGRNWVLTSNSRAGNWRFALSKSPGYIYEMDFISVPGDIKRAGRKVVAAFGEGGIKYGVTLPAHIRGEISRYMSERTGGDLIIDMDGKVKCE